MNLKVESNYKDSIDCGFKTPMFDFLSKAELEHINQHRFEVKYKKGETIRKQGTFLSHVITLNTGLAKLYIEGFDNRDLILRIIKPSQFIGGPGMYSDLKHHYSVAALVDTSACFIDVKIFKEIIQTNADFASEFMKEFSIKMLLTYDRLISLTQKQIPGRMADALIYLSKEIFKSNIIEGILSNQDLADLTSMSKDSAVKVLREFKNEGVLNIDKNSIEVTNMEALQKISNIG